MQLEKRQNDKISIFSSCNFHYQNHNINYNEPSRGGRCILVVEQCNQSLLHCYNIYESPIKQTYLVTMVTDVDVSGHIVNHFGNQILQQVASSRTCVTEGLRLALIFIFSALKRLLVLPALFWQDTIGVELPQNLK